MAVDYGTWAGWQVFCAVLVWSRIRFVRIAADQTQPTTLGLLAECFEELGGIPAVVLADRIACLRGPIVADRVVTHPDYVRLATHYGFRPDWYESADPQSKGVVENLVGYAQTDLVVPSCDGWTSLGLDELLEPRAQLGAVRVGGAHDAAVVTAVEGVRIEGRPLPGPLGHLLAVERARQRLGAGLVVVAVHHLLPPAVGDAPETACSSPLEGNP